MSRQVLKEHWKGLAFFAAIFLAIVAMGPLVFYGFPYIYEAMVEGRSLPLLLAIGGSIPLWIFGGLWLFDRLTNRAESSDVADLHCETDNGR